METFEVDTPDINKICNLLRQFTSFDLDNL